MRVVAVELQLDMQPVVAQQHAGELSRAFTVPGELPGVREPGSRAVGESGFELHAIATPVPASTAASAALAQGVADDVRVRAVREGRDLVQKLVRPRDHAPASRRVESTGIRIIVFAGDDVGAVERVVEAAPAGIGGIEGVPGVVDRDDELGTGDERDLVVDVAGLDPEVLAGWKQVTDGFEEGPVLGRIDGARGAFRMPCVDLLLEPVPPIEKGAVPRPEIPYDVRERAPERLRRDPRPGGDFVVDQIMQTPHDLEAADRHSLVHRSRSRIAPSLVHASAGGRENSRTGRV